MSDIDIRVTPALHPENVKEIDGYDETVAHLLGPVETAFSEAYLGLASIHNARAAAGLNPTWNEAAAICNTQDFADKVFQRVAKRFDTVARNLNNSIALLEQELSAPVANRAAHNMSSEIRAHAKGLPETKRIGFVQSLIEAGDVASASAILGAPAFLSGLNHEMTVAITRVFHEKANPEAAKRLRVLKGAADLVGQRSGLMFKESEKAVGAPIQKVARLREARNAAEKAFVLKNA